MMEIVFVRPSMQPRNFFQGHGESVQKSGYLQEERVEFVWEKQQQKKLGLKSVSQSVDELRETFTCWEGYYSWYFLFFLILYIVISWWISNESTCIIVIIIIMNHATWMIIFTASTSSSTTLEFRDSDFSVLVLCLCCWCDFCNGGWMVPCLSVGEKSHHHMVSMCRSNTEAIMTLTCQWLLLTNTGLV